MKQIKDYLKKIYTYFHEHDYIIKECLIDDEHGKKFNADCKTCHMKFHVYFNKYGECFLVKEIV